MKHVTIVLNASGPNPNPFWEHVTIVLNDSYPTLTWFITYASIISSFIPYPSRVQCKEKQKHANRPLSVVGYLYFKKWNVYKKIKRPQ